MERLTNFTRRLVAVPKSEVDKLDKQWRADKLRHKKRR